MATALRPSTPPPPALRAKPLRMDEANIGHIRSLRRRRGRERARRLIVLPAMEQVRALIADVAEAIDIDERAASRTVHGRDPFDFGDALCIAESGPGGLRLARRIAALFSAELDRIESHR